VLIDLNPSCTIVSITNGPFIIRAMLWVRNSPVSVCEGLHQIRIIMLLTKRRQTLTGGHKNLVITGRRLYIADLSCNRDGTGCD